jgi:hypothetical protein
VVHRLCEVFQTKSICTPLGRTNDILKSYGSFFFTVVPYNTLRVPVSTQGLLVQKTFAFSFSCYKENVHRCFHLYGARFQDLIAKLSTNDHVQIRDKK